MTFRRFTIAAAALSLLALLSLGARRGDATAALENDAPEPLVVETMTATPVDSFSVARSYTGLIRASRTSQLGFERSARVTRLLVDEGDSVEQGDLLAELDSRQLAIQRDRLEAQRKEASAVLSELVAGPRAEVIEAARAEVRDWQAQLELQRRNLARTTELVNQNAVSRERHDAAELGVESIEARLLASSKRLEELEAGTRQEKIDAQTAVVQQLSASIADLEIEIGDSKLVAPFAGTISRRHVDDGTVVSSAQSVLELVEIDGLEARIGLPPRVFEKLAAETQVTIEIGNRSWPAVYERAAATVDLQTRTRTAIFQLAAEASSLVVPGEVARIAFDEMNEETGYWLPTRSLIRSTRGLWAVYAADGVNTNAEADSDYEVVRREVEVIHTDAEQTFVRGLIKPGDQIIVAGTQRVVPGQRVRPSVPSNDIELVVPTSTITN